MLLLRHNQNIQSKIQDALFCKRAKQRTKALILTGYKFVRHSLWKTTEKIVG